MKRSARWLAGAALLVGGLVLANCVSVLGLDAYEDAISALCKCDQELPKLSGSCEETLRFRLDNASPTTRQQWLEYFDQNCAGSCQNATQCFGQPGTCSQLACQSDEECCGYVDGIRGCDSAIQGGTCVDKVAQPEED